MAVAIRLVVADEDAPVPVFALAADAGGQALAAEAARVQAYVVGLAAHDGLEVQLAAQRAGGRALGIGAAPHGDQRAVARLQRADDEGAVRLVERQAVLQQQYAAVHGIALDARAADVQARLVLAAEELLHHDAGLAADRVLQGVQAHFSCGATRLTPPGVRSSCWRRRVALGDSSGVALSVSPLTTTGGSVGPAPAPCARTRDGRASMARARGCVS